MKALVIEQDTAFKAQLGVYLAEKECEISFVESVDDVHELPSYDIWDVVFINTGVVGSFCFAQSCANTLPNTDIVFISQRYSLKENLTCYELGAAMYLAKPFSPVELLSALDILFKRRQMLKIRDNAAIKLCTSSRILYSDHWIVHLSEKECMLLHALALAEQLTLESWQLMERLQITDSEAAVKYLGIIVSRLRTKLKENGLQDQAIKAVRGQGYQLTLSIQMI